MIETIIKGLHVFVIIHFPILISVGFDLIHLAKIITEIMYNYIGWLFTGRVNNHG